MKKEKYITARYYTGTDKLKGYQVIIRRQGVLLTNQFFSVATYGDERIARTAAIMHRDDTLSSANDSVLIDTRISTTFYEVFKMSLELFPIRLETQRKKEYSLNKYLSQIKDKPIKDIKAYHAMDCLNKMIETCTQDNINRVATIMKDTFKTARIKHLVKVNIMEEVIVPKSKVFKTKRSMVLEYDKYLKVVDLLLKSSEKGDLFAVRRRSLAGAIVAMYYLGLRPCEALAITKDCVDMRRRLVHINKEVGSSTTESSCIRSVKTEQSDRFIPVPDELANILTKYIDLSGDSDFVFPDYTGSFIPNRVAIQTINTFCKQHNIQGFRMYQLRHQFSTDLVLNNVDVRTIMELMGHSNTSMTINYARSNQEVKKEVIDIRSSLNKS